MDESVVDDIYGHSEDPFTKEKKFIRRYTLCNANEMIVEVITLGATINSLRFPNNRQGTDDVVLGFDEIAGYLDPEVNPYFGATIGRVANRIGKGTFVLKGKRIKVSKNHKDKHMLHGGFIGFNNVHWELVKMDPATCSVILKHVSADGHEGFPGQLTATVEYKLTDDNCLNIRYEATTTKPTPVNLTNHSYFNLAGHKAGRPAIEKHKIYIKADKITATDKDSIPTGELLDVTGTPYDFREMAELGQRIQQTSGKGFDDNFCVNLDNNGITMVAKAVSPDSGIWMEVYSDQPGLQFYTGNYLPNPKNMETPIVGKLDGKYYRQGAFCFETQGFPDAVNHRNFPSIILKPSEKYVHNVIYKFGLNK